MPEKIRAKSSRSKATGRPKATAHQVKARKATARGNLHKNTKPLSTAKEPQAEEESKSEGEEEEESEAKAHNQPENRFTKTTWSKGKKAQKRAERNAEGKNAKREKKIKAEAEDARVREQKLKEEAEEARAKSQAYAHQQRMSAKKRYEQWASACTDFFADPHASARKFPIPKNLKFCTKFVCIKGEKLGWLKKERLRWHPDKFPGREEVKELAQEMFQMFQRLIDGDNIKVGPSMGR
ncbi:uncharacterized protein K444DRAFT_631023 [Hyaloscypha bicolor E]|uniref:J domain-containing protein n=1 Tax=Hyaloscypha bicolor E TaxID=1095630 RepID=A0A2J6T5Y6_9HELO|nr:uncharacterized protein K444DRAFT_631023 [Hyaloscypha bicolor E]PMD58431.1 hypothetical protein K444DRAFT_631023 [Hyaloscypha bicolor E]